MRGQGRRLPLSGLDGRVELPQLPGCDLQALPGRGRPAAAGRRRRQRGELGADRPGVLGQARQDVSTYVRLYDFMSQIVDYGDPYMEMLSIFLRLLEKVIADSSWSAEVDLSDVVLVGVKHNKTIRSTSP